MEQVRGERRVHESSEQWDFTEEVVRDGNLFSSL